VAARASEARLPAGRLLPAGRGRALLAPAIVSAIALAAVAWWASRQQLPDLPPASEALPRLTAALALYAVATCLRGERWMRLLRHAGAGLSRTDAYAVTTVGYMGNNALPARAGDLLKSVLSSRQAGTATADGFGTLVAERVLDALALVVIFAVLVTTLSLPLGVEGWMLAAVGAGLALAAAAAAFLGRDTGAGQRIRELAARLLAPTRRLWSTAGAGLLALSIVLWLIEGAVYAVLGAVAGVHLSLLDGLYIMALANLVALVPAAPGYLGTFDAAVLLGVRLVAGGTHAAALAYAVVVRFVLFVPITLVGLVALVVRYGGLRRVSVALRRPATAVPAR
jgi:glycosyltransferase 2 family protein